MDKNIVISISRKYGCGGRELAQILAEKLNIKLYDRKIVHIAAANPLTMAFFPFRSFGINLGEASRGIFLSEAKAIRRLANSGSCVILGRCADFVLDDLPNHFSIFVTADDEFRTERGKNVYGGKTLKELNIEDKKRGRYYNYYTGKEWGDPTNYNLVVNVSKFSLDEVAEAIIKYIEKVQVNRTK